MRPSLLPGLLAAAARNAARGAEAIRLFEIGRRYLEDAERPTLGLVLAGPRGPAALARQGAAPSTPMTPRRRRWRSSPPPARRSTICRCWASASAVYHPGQSGRLCLGPKTVLAEFGALHPRDRARRSTSTARWSPPRFSSTPSRRSAAGPATCARAYAPPPLQAVKRDFAFLVPAELPADAAAPRGQGRRQGGDRGGEPVRRLHRRGRPRGPEVARRRGDAPARREELHRRGAEGDLGPDRRRGGEAGRDAQGLMAEEAKVRASFAEQAYWCARLGSPFTALLCEALGERARPEHRSRPRALDWPGDPAARRRCAGAAAVRRPACPGPQRRGAGAGAASIRRAPARGEALRRALAPVLARRGLARPGSTRAPQTNEVGRSAVLMAA